MRTNPKLKTNSSKQQETTVLRPKKSGSTFKSNGSSKKSLKSGRPPLLSSSSSAPTSASTSTTTTSKPKSKPINKQSSKATKTLINAHHNLHKARAKAVATGDSDLIKQIDKELSELGGLEAYQHASLTGQSADRGGDSSVLLVKWLQEGVDGDDDRGNDEEGEDEDEEGDDDDDDDQVESEKVCRSRIRSNLKVLEIGALSSRNAISKAMNDRHNDHKSGNNNNKNQKPLIQSVKRIDLRSQEPDTIEEIDFMNFPLPTSHTQKYDVISLSLVLNYVPDAASRGEMLKRTRLFLAESEDGLESRSKTKSKSKPISTSKMNRQKQPSITPCLFLVLPLPCLNNSRYMTVDRFRELMVTLGYTSVRCHQSAKLHYELFRFDHGFLVGRVGGEGEDKLQKFKKIEVNPGKGRNNFCVTLL